MSKLVPPPEAPRRTKAEGHMAGMTCGIARPLLNAFSLGTLSSITAKQVRRHLERCDSCRRDLAERRQMRSRLSHLDLRPPPPGLWERVKTGQIDPAERGGRCDRTEEI